MAIEGWIFLIALIAVLVRDGWQMHRQAQVMEDMRAWQQTVKTVAYHRPQRKGTHPQE